MSKSNWKVSTNYDTKKHVDVVVYVSECACGSEHVPVLCDIVRRVYKKRAVSCFRA